MYKNTTTIIVCKYVLEKKAISMRALARLLSIHHKSCQRYISGKCRPSPQVKLRLVRLMKTNSFEELINDAFLFYRNGIGVGRIDDS